MMEQEIWDLYKRLDPDAKSYEAWAFCGGGRLADELADLVLKGLKTGTASLYELYHIEGAPLPSKGGLSMILKDNGEAACIVRTTGVHVCKFSEVSAEHAFKEGEGDRSLEHWRKVHKEFFTRELEHYELQFDEDMLVVCETFEVVFR